MTTEVDLAKVKEELASVGFDNLDDFKKMMEENLIKDLLKIPASDDVKAKIIREQLYLMIKHHYFTTFS